MYVNKASRHNVTVVYWLKRDVGTKRSYRYIDKNVNIFVRGMCITQRKIVSSYCFKQCLNKYCSQNIVTFDVIYYASE